MKISVAVFALLCCTAVLAAIHKDRMPVSKRYHSGVPAEWRVLDKAPRDGEFITFSVLMKQRNLDILNERFEAVSNPKSADWGKFLTREEVQDIVRPEESAFEEVESWLATLGTKKIVRGADYITVTTTVRDASTLFQVPFKTYEHKYNGKSLIRTLGVASVPTNVRKHIDFVAGISELFTGSKPFTAHRFGENKHATQSKSGRSNLKDIQVTPSLLKQYYNVPAGLVGTNPKNVQGIAAFQDFFSFGALQAFEQNFQLPQANVTRIGTDCKAQGCDQYESDLDVQYITAMAQNVPLTFINQDPNYWILQWAQQVANEVTPLPLVFSVSYGWSELAQCDIASANCDKLGYNSNQYVTRTNTALQQLGTLGISVLVSDGDDGAPSLGGVVGNCPQDPNNYCPVGGCQYQNSSCMGISVVNNTDGSLCIFPMGEGSDACGVTLADPNFNTVLQAFANQNSQCNFNLDQDQGQNYHIYSSCSCDQLQNVTSNGYTIGGYIFEQSNGPIFVADYPTSSPYVTSVGATQFLGSNSVTSEVACSILNGALITTGGGFSSFQPQPNWQSDAITNWLNFPGNNAPPSWSFDATKRGYPDVAFNGHNYQIYYSSSNTDQCPCQETSVDGTSCSSPAFAGLVSLINDQLLNNNQSPLGFLNNLLYQMADEAPQAFNDITSGNNNCNRAYCCQYGYEAVKGWDPVSGLGSPNFQEMLNYILKKKGVQL